MVGRRSRDGSLTEEEKSIYLFDVAFPEDRQAAYLSEEDLEFFHHVFKTYEQILERVWALEENVILRIYDDTLIDNPNKESDEDPEKIPRGYVEDSLYSAALIEACIMQLSSMNLAAKKEIHRLYENEAGLAQTITTPAKEIALFRSEDDKDKISITAAKVDGYNKHFDQYFVIARRLYEGTISEEEIAEHNVSLLYKYIMYNFPKLIYVADYYHELNRERILLKQGMDEFTSWSYSFIQEYEKEVEERITEHHLHEKETDKTIERVIAKIEKITSLLELCEEEEREEKGLKLRKIITKIKRLEN